MATLRTAPSPRDPDVTRLVEADYTDAAIADALGVSESCIRQDRRYLGLLRRVTPAPPVSDDTLRAYHAEGLDNAAIAERSGLTRGSVRERLSRLRLRSHPTGAQIKSRFGGAGDGGLG